MQTTVDIPDQLLTELNAFANEENVSQEELIRRAIDSYVGILRNKKNTKDDQDAFEAVRGIWKDRGIDGLEYQRKLREEWDREWDR